MRDGKFGNPLGVVDASTVEPADRQRIATELGYSETIFVDSARRTERTPRTPTSSPRPPNCRSPATRPSERRGGCANRGTPINTLQVPAGIVQVSYDGDLTAVSARAEWAPDFAIHDLDSIDELSAADPDDYTDDAEHYLWTWPDRDSGAMRSRMFAADLGVPRGRGHRCGGGANHRLPQPRPDHHAGQGLGHRNDVELRRLGAGRGPCRRRRHAQID